MAEQKQNENAPSFRVTYYAFTGRAEPLRLAAALGGIAFEDKFITQQQQKTEKAEGTLYFICTIPQIHTVKT